MDEKTIQTYPNGRVLVKRRVNQRYDPDKIVTNETQNTQNKVNLVGLISCTDPNMIYSVSTHLTGDEFKQLMERKIKNILTEYSIVVMDRASIHNKGLEFLNESGIHVIRDFPPKSNDLNPIENIWAELQKRANKKLRNFNVSTKDQLLNIIGQSWTEIPFDVIRTTIMSMPLRLKEVIRMQGRQTRF